MTWLKYLGAALAAAAIFVSGYKYAASIYKAEIAQLREEHALATKELTDEYREKERGQAQQLADAWDKYEKARAESVDLRADADRVRIEANRYRARLSAADTDSCDAIRERLASCTKLLEEGAKLSAEGAELAQRIAEKKDALSTVTGLAD